MKTHCFFPHSIVQIFGDLSGIYFEITISFKRDISKKKCRVTKLTRTQVSPLLPCRFNPQPLKVVCAQRANPLGQPMSLWFVPLNVILAWSVHYGWVKFSVDILHFRNIRPRPTACIMPQPRLVMAQPRLVMASPVTFQVGLRTKMPGSGGVYWAVMPPPRSFPASLVSFLSGHYTPVNPSWAGIILYVETGSIREVLQRRFDLSQVGDVCF